MTEIRSTPPQRRTMTLLIALFFLPLAASFVLYYGMEWRPAGGSNHGELLQPIRQLPESLGQLEGKWSLAYVGNGACDSACRDALYIARQVHTLLNKDMGRVNRVLLATEACCDQGLPAAGHAGLLMVDVAEPAARDALLAELPPGDHAHDLFVIDPLLNIVLRFDAREDPKGLLTDMKKLLKLSSIG